MIVVGLVYLLIGVLAGQHDQGTRLSYAIVVLMWPVLLLSAILKGRIR